MKAEFEIASVKPNNHVGLYSSIEDDGFVVFFCDEENSQYGVVVASGQYCKVVYKVGHASNNWKSCDSGHWKKLDANSVTFTW